MRDDKGINISRAAYMFAKQLSGSLHRAQTTIKEHARPFGPDQQAIALATASQALKGKGHSWIPFLVLFEIARHLFAGVPAFGHIVPGGLVDGTDMPIHPQDAGSSAGSEGLVVSDLVPEDFSIEFRAWATLPILS